MCDSFSFRSVMKQEYMELALKYANKSYKMDEVPVGCVVVKDDEVVGYGYNRRETKQNPLEHAEMMAINQAAKKLKTWRLQGCDLYVTLEPCPMCAGAIIQARIDRVFFGAHDPKSGSFGSVMDITQIKGLNHYPEIKGGILDESSKELLVEFFRKKRKQTSAKRNV